MSPLTHSPTCGTLPPSSNERGMSMNIGGFEVGVIILGVVEVAKKFGVNGKWSLGLALALGAVLFGYGSAVDAGLINEAIAVWATVVVRSVGYTLAVPGLYDLFVKRVAGK